MGNNYVVNANENDPAFQKDLERRLKLAKNPKNRIPLGIAKKDIMRKYQKLARAKV